MTGCSTGIGRETALALHHAGLPVYASARRLESLSDLAAGGLTILALDVTDEASMQTAVDRVLTDHGVVGVLVNNAGYALQGPVETRARPRTQGSGGRLPCDMPRRTTAAECGWPAAPMRSPE